jgi:isopentenyldiphosphate isomerase
MSYEEEELIDVRDANGMATGIRKTKSDVHRDGDWHRAVHVWIVTPSRQLLLQRRAATKENHPGMLDVSAAGHISAGELAWDAAIRETGEEIGIAITRAELQQIARLREEHLLNGGRYVDREIHEIFVVIRSVDTATLTLQESEVDSVQLVDVETFREMVARQQPDLVPHWEEYDLLLDRI